MRKPRPPMWTDDPVKDAEAWDEYLEHQNDEEPEEPEYDRWEDLYGITSTRARAKRLG